MRNEQQKLKSKKAGKGFKRTAVIVAVLLVTVLMTAVLYGCKDKETPFDFTTVYKSESDRNYNSAEKMIELPDNTIVQTFTLTGDGSTTSSTNYVARRTNYTGYIDSYDGFVLTNKNINGSGGANYFKYGFYKVGDSKITVPVENIKIYFRHGLIATMLESGLVGVYDTTGALLLAHGSDAFNVKGATSTNSADVLWNTVEIYSPKYVGYKRSDGTATYTKIVDAYTKKEVASLLDTEFSSIQIFDDYMAVTKEVSSGQEAVSIVKLGGAKITAMPTSGNGYFEMYGSAELDKMHFTYLGGGRFFVLVQTAGTSEGYYYHEPDSKYYYSVNMNFYEAETDARVKYLGDVIPSGRMLNSYYADEAQNTGESMKIDSILQDGYNYAGIAFVRDKKKEIYFDQLILDRDMNIIVSLSNTYGVSTDEEGDLRMLALVYNNGYGVSQFIINNEIKVYDKYGELVSNITSDEYAFESARYSAGKLIVKIKTYDEAASKTVYKYGIMDVNGNIKVGFEYDYITEFISGYAMAVKLGEIEAKVSGTTTTYTQKYEFVIIDSLLNTYKDNDIGTSIAMTPTAGSTKTSPSSAVYFNGVYAYKVADSQYGLRNYNINSSEADLFDGKLFASITLIRSNLTSPVDFRKDHGDRIFVMAQDVAKGVYTLYRLVG